MNNSAHSYTEGATFTPNSTVRNPITREFLKEAGFITDDDSVFALVIPNPDDDRLAGIIVTVDFGKLSPLVSLYIGGLDAYLPITTQFGITKLVGALRGK